MKKGYAVYIPEPCHEDWQQMAPAAQGRFCHSCAKHVVDFSAMTDEQILNHISKAAGGMCGRFANHQLQRPLLPAKRETNKVWWVAAILPLVMFFEKAGAQKKNYKYKNTENIIDLIPESRVLFGELAIIEHSNNSDEDNEPDRYDFNDSNQFNKQITVWRKKGTSNFTLTGKIENAKDKSPVPFATIGIQGTKIAAVSNENGHFKLTGNSTNNNIVLTISCIGFASTELVLNLNDSVEVDTNAPNIIIGKVVEINGRGIPFANIKEMRSNQTVTCDAEGAFLLTIPQKQKKALLTASSVGFSQAQISVSSKEKNEIVISCNQLTMGLTDLVVKEKIKVKTKPEKLNKFPNIARKIFNPDAFKTFPNPASAGNNITVDVAKPGQYAIQLLNNNGQLIHVKQFDAPKGYTQTAFLIPTTVAAGVYYIRLVDNKTGKQYTNKIAVQ